MKKARTFWTPFGRYRYLRMPFWINWAPEEYQRRQIEIVQGLPGTAVIADDILVYGCDIAEHDRNLRAVLQRARETNLKLNRKKLRLLLSEVTYMGQRLTSNGVRPDPCEVEAIRNMTRPDSKKAVQRLLGCINCLSPYLPRLADVSEPLRKLNESTALFTWQSQQEESFNQIKDMITSAPVLKYYDKCLAIVFSCERFDQYLHGRKMITVNTDHKPLVPIFTKPIHTAPKWLQRMLLRLQKYKLRGQYLPGSQMYIADMLSRAYLKTTGSSQLSDHQIFHLRQQERLFAEIESIRQSKYIRMKILLNFKPKMRRRKIQYF